MEREDEMRTAVGACLLALSLPAAAPARAIEAAERAYMHGQYVVSARLFLSEAKSGRALAQTHLGYQYQYGLGVPQSYEEAARWYACAAEQGEPNAQFYLGQLFDRGQGVGEDPVEAGKWLDLAAAHAPAGRGEYWRTMRDEIGAKMTLDELAEARRRAVAWRPSFACEAPSESEALQLPTKKYSGR
jgi:TPR repeat protein